MRCWRVGGEVRERCWGGAGEVLGRRWEMSLKVVFWLDEVSVK